MAGTRAAGRLTVLDEPRRVATVLPPIRRRILALLDPPDSASGLARKLGLPRQKLNYHLRALERAGFVELAETRQRRGCFERRMRTTARAYLVSPALLGRLGSEPEALRDRFSASYLISTAARLVEEVAVLRRRAERAGKRLATFTLETEVSFASPAERTRFIAELTRAVGRLAAKYHRGSPGSRKYRLVAAGHAAITKPEGGDHDQER